MYRAGKKLAADYPDYAKAIRGTARAVSASCVVALTMARSDALGKSARENKDVQRAIALMAAEMEAFPESRSCWDWAVLGGRRAPRDDLRTKCLAPDELDEIQREISQCLAPINAHAAFETYWRRQAAGDAARPRTARPARQTRRAAAGGLDSSQRVRKNYGYRL